MLHVFGGDEGGLEVDLGELRLAVGAEILVAEAAGDLEIAVVAGHHQQLLVDLRRLRQGVELARVDAARHQVVPRALGRRLGEDRGLDLEEPQVGQRPAGALQQTVAEDEVALQLRPPEIEHPVLEPQLLRGQLLVLLPRHGNGGRLRRSDDLELGDVHLDLARRELRVARGLGPERHRPAHQHDRFRPRRRRARHHLGRGPVRIAGELHQPGPVAQIDEDQAAQVAAAMHPSAEPDRLPTCARVSSPARWVRRAVALMPAPGERGNGTGHALRRRGGH